MTAKPFSPASARRAVQAATLALLIGFAVSGTSLAAEIKPPSSKTKRHNDRDVTIIVIDKDDHSSRSKAGKLDPSLPDPARAPASRTIRDDDELTIRIRRNRDTRTGSTRKPGPKIITIDKNSGACGGGGVCVIRP
ncbi:hypothetical protein [Hoeflea sp.]|uniref:hypothetical protein n=1 Tax=Hoeflea sp. TaxID=1940281 RepID=UPI003A948B38